MIPPLTDYFTLDKIYFLLKSSQKKMNIFSEVLTDPNKDLSDRERRQAKAYTPKVNNNNNYLELKNMNRLWNSSYVNCRVAASLKLDPAQTYEKKLDPDPILENEP